MSTVQITQHDTYASLISPMVIYSRYDSTSPDKEGRELKKTGFPGCWCSYDSTVFKLRLHLVMRHRLVRCSRIKRGMSTWKLASPRFLHRLSIYQPLKAHLIRTYQHVVSFWHSKVFIPSGNVHEYILGPESLSSFLLGQNLTTLNKNLKAHFDFGYLKPIPNKFLS